VKDERTASTKERSCSSTNLIDEAEILVVIPTKLLVALWLGGDNTEEKRKEREGVEEARRKTQKKKKKKKKSQVGFSVFLI